MRSGSTLNQFNDDDFFDTGPCPSCRLAINKETGRLKWCMGGSEVWRFRIKLMLLIPALLLPITIVFIALSRFQVTTKISDSRVSSTYETRKQDERNIENIFLSGTNNNIKRAAEEIEDEDRVLLPDTRTSYVPVEMHPSFWSALRRKRDIDVENRTVDKSVSRVYYKFDARTTFSLRARARLDHGESGEFSFSEEL